MRKSVTFFVGGVTSFNTQLDTINIGKMLSDEFDLHLIATDETYENDRFKRYFQIFGTDYSTTLSGSIRAIRSYLEANESITIMNISKPTKHGLLLGSLCRNDDVTYVYRYPGSNFTFYKICEGWRKPGYFILNNVICRPGLYMADEFVALGPHGKNELTQLRVPQEAISILPTPVDCSRLQTEETKLNLDLNDETSVVMFVGRLVRTKGTEILRDTIPQVLNRRDDIHFLIVGPGEFPDIPKTYDDQVTITGAVPPESIGNYYDMADVLVLPSYSEGLPRVLLEGLCLDTKLIASEAGDIPSVTSNIFETKSEFVDMICNYESLQQDELEEFTVDSLKSEYVDFFHQIT